MTPEISLTLENGKELTASTITVGTYRKYCELMEKADDFTEKSDVVFISSQIIREVFRNQISIREINDLDAETVFATAKTIHFVMQEIVAPKFLELMSDKDKQEVEAVEKSAFDDYDEAEGYNSDLQKQNVWRTCKENIDRIVKLSIRAFNNSLSQCMDSDVMSLLDYVKFELETAKEK